MLLSRPVLSTRVATNLIHEKNTASPLFLVPQLDLIHFKKSATIIPSATFMNSRHMYEPGQTIIHFVHHIVQNIAPGS